MDGCVRAAPTVERGSEAWLLAERVKELDCLYGVARVFEGDGRPLTEILQAVVDLLPAGFQHVDAAGARLDLDGERYVTEGYHDTPWALSYPVVVRGETAGRLTVSYSRETALCDEGPFLREELNMLSVIAQRLGSYVEKRESQRQLLDHQESLRSLATELAMSEQRERRRIAELLHDRIGQALTLLSMRLAQARTAAGDERLDRMLRETEGLVGEIIADTRSLTFELCPPILYELGLLPALEWLAERFEAASGLAIEVRQENGPEAVSEELRTTLFQAVRELLTNVVKHAEARSVVVTVGGGVDFIELSVRDDGVGTRVRRSAHPLDPTGGFGLFSLRERLAYMGGSLRLESGQSGGTTVVLRVPCRD